MEIITISGTVYGNVETKKDKTGKSYLRFRVVCWSKDMTGKMTARYYRCFTYKTEFSDLRDKQTIFVSGIFRYSVNEKNQVSLNIDCQNINIPNQNLCE